VSKRAAHHLHDLRVLEGPPGNLKGSVMVCCEAYPNLQVWQRLDFHRMDLPQPEDGQGLREVMRHRRILCLRGDDAAHGEAFGQCVGVSRQSLEKLSEKVSGGSSSVLYRA